MLARQRCRSDEALALCRRRTSISGLSGAAVPDPCGMSAESGWQEGRGAHATVSAAPSPGRDRMKSGKGQNLRREGQLLLS